MDKINMLLVEDEQMLAMIIKETLEEKGEFIIHCAENGKEGLEAFYQTNPDIIVADVMMPVMDGFEMVKQIRETNSNTPVLFLTSRSSVDDVVEGFSLGGNDYLKKPFGMSELIVRIKALLNRVCVKKQELDQYKIGDYTFAPITQNLHYNGDKVILSNRESEILKRLCENKNHVLHTQNLLLDLWGEDGYFTTRSLHVFITKLRRKLAKDNSISILNIRGIGYKLIEE